MTKTYKIEGIILFLVIIATNIVLIKFLVVSSYDEGYNDHREEMLQYNDSCDMRFPDQNVTSILGVYEHPNYFCVWTNSRTPDQIAETTFHEMSHYYAFNDPKHFNVNESELMNEKKEKK